MALTESGMAQRDFYQLISGDERKMLTDQQSYPKTRQAELCEYPSLAGETEINESREQKPH